MDSAWCEEVLRPKKLVADWKVACFLEKFAGAFSHAALVAPEPEVEAVAKAETLIAADLSEPGCVKIQFVSRAPFRHQENPLRRESVGGDQPLDFLKIDGLCDDKFEPCFRRLGEKFQGWRVEPEGLGHGGI